MSLEVTLQNAISGLQTSKQSLQVLSDNIANVNTEGYSRKIVAQTARTIDGQGYGVDLAKITRVVDSAILNQLRTQNGVVQKLTTQQDFLTQVNALFGKPEDSNSFVHAIADLGAQFASLAISPETESNQYLTTQSGTDVVNNLKYTSDQIQRLRSTASQRLNTQITEFNDKMDIVVSLNSKIISFNASNLSTADLEDQRDQALNRMSEIMDIKYFQKSDGSLSVFTGGGQTLINGQQAQHLTYNQPATLAPTLHYTPTDAVNYIIPGQPGYPVGGIPGIYVGQQISSQDITSDIGSGSLKGLLDIRDSALPGLQAQLDELSEKMKDGINSAHNTGSGFPPVVGFTGDRYVESATSLQGSGLVRIGVVDQTGALQNGQVLDLSSYSDVGSLVTALNGISNVSASINSDGRLQISATNNNRIAINELTSNISAAGDLNKGFSDFFGLNNFYTSSENFSIYRGDVVSTSTGAVPTTAGTLQFTASGVNTTVTYNANDSLDNLATAINGNATLSSAGISALVVNDGAGLRLQVSDSGGDNFAMVETGGGNVLDKINLRADYRGISNRLSVRSDIKDNTFFVSRGALQSNAFSSTQGTITSTSTALSAAGLSAGGTLSFTLADGTTASISYATTDTLDNVITAINSNTTLSTAGITAQSIVSGSNYSLKISDAQSDNFWIADSQPTNGLGVATTQGVSVGDGSIAANISDAFNATTTFLAAPAAGGGLARTTSSFTDYAANILAFNSAQTNATNSQTTAQQSLATELSSKNSSISGVNMDEELSNLIVYQQAYMASARMISTTQELYKVLTDMVQ